MAHGPLVFNWDNLLKGCYFFMGMEIFYKHLVPHKYVVHFCSLYPFSPLLLRTKINEIDYTDLD